MQDFTGVPCIVDLATMREAVGELGGDTEKETLAIGRGLFVGCASSCGRG